MIVVLDECIKYITLRDNITKIIDSSRGTIIFHRL